MFFRIISLVHARLPAGIPLGKTPSGTITHTVGWLTSWSSSIILANSQLNRETNMENPISTDQYQSPGHSFWGILSCVLPFIILFGVISNYPSFSLMGTPAGSFFLYCISPVGLLSGFVLSVGELRKKHRKRFFPILGIVIALIAVAPMLLEWLLGLMQGVPFSCLEDPSFCGW